jgi:hypothetical protein
MTFTEWKAAHPEYKPTTSVASADSTVGDLAIGVIRLALVVGCLVGLVMFFVAVL